MRNAFFGWRVVGTAFVVAVFGWGISFYGPPIFLQHLHATRGWPISLISAAITSHYLLGAIVVANLAALYRRFGTVRITRAGALLTAAGLLGWVYAEEPWQLFLATPVSGAGWAMTGGAALNAMVSPWFIRRRPAALSMAFNGASMGGVVFSPLWVVLIGWLGLPAAGTLVAAAVLVVLWFLAGRYLGSSPAAMGLAPDGDAALAASSHRMATATLEVAPPLPSPWRDRRFVTLAGASTLGLFAQIGLLAHLFSLLVPIIGEAGAGATMGAVTACAIGGRSLLGLTMPDGADRRVIAGANFALQAAGSLVLAGAFLAGAPLVLPVLLGCSLFGLGIGNVTSLPALIAQAEFRTVDLSRVVSLATATGQAGYAFAPAVFGLLREFDGVASAPLLFATACMFQVAAAATMLAGRRAAARRAVRA